MIKVTNSYFNISADAEQAIVIKNGIYLFVIISMAGAGTANVRLAWSYELETAKEGSQIALPDVTAAELEGGTGPDAYSKLIDRVQKIAIAYLQPFNQGCTFEIVSPEKPNLAE